MSNVDTIENLYLQLLGSSDNPRQRESLERIKKACTYLEQQGLKISPSAIERYCLDRDWKGPKAQSIRNSKTLKLYVDTLQSGQILDINRSKVSKTPLIADETVRAYVNLLEEERDQAIAARNRIEAGLRSIPGISIDDLIRTGFSDISTNALSIKAPTQIPQIAQAAIQVLFDPQHLNDCGLQMHKDRLRQVITGNVLLEKNHVIALRKLLTDTDEDNSSQTDAPNN